MDAGISAMLMARQMRPPFSFWSYPKRERAAPGVREKGALAATLHVRAKLLYGGRREMVPAGLRWLPDGRGGVRYRLERGFPRRGCALGRGAKLYLISLFFRAFRFATRCPGGRRGLCFRADEGIGPYAGVGTPARADTQVSPYGWAGPRFSVGANAHLRPVHQFPRGTASGSEKRSRDNAITTPTTSAPSATGRLLQTCRREKRARRQVKIGACTDPPTPVARRRERAGARLSGLFFWTVHGPFSFPQEGKENGGCIPLDQPPVGAESPVAAGRRPIPCYPRTSLRPSR